MEDSCSVILNAFNWLISMLIDLYGTQMFITMFNKEIRKPDPILGQFNPHLYNLTSQIHFSVLKSIPMSTKRSHHLRVFQPTFCMHFSYPPCALYILVITLDFIMPPILDKEKRSTKILTITPVHQVRPDNHLLRETEYTKSSSSQSWVVNIAWVSHHTLALKYPESDQSNLWSMEQ